MEFDINDRNLADVISAIRVKEIVIFAKENETIRALTKPDTFTAKVMDGLLRIAEEYLESVKVK